MEKEKIKQLLHKYSIGQCSDAEKAWVEALYERLATNSANDLSDEIIQNDLEDIYQRLPHRYQAKRSIRWPRLAVAAVLLVFISIGFYFYLQPTAFTRGTKSSQQAKAKAVDFAPGSNKATLTLSDGSTIALDDSIEEDLVRQAGIKITKSKVGMIVYQVSPDTKSSEWNRLSTPKGGQYQVILADGTKIWLNAASSITYPTSFNGKERKVRLKGEGYFEVAKNEKQPFKVVTEQQELEVLGTHFNINSYADEPNTKTTLLEGSVKVSALHRQNAIMLKPGEQSTLKKSGKINVNAVDAENAVAWKSGLFQFQDSDIRQAMRQLSRWYDVAIEFEGPVPNIKLWGEVHRNATAVEALEILSYFDLKYKIVNNENTKKIVIIQ